MMFLLNYKYWVELISIFFYMGSGGVEAVTSLSHVDCYMPVAALLCNSSSRITLCAHISTSIQSINTVVA